MDFVLVQYKAVCDYAKDTNVIPLIETNGMLADSRVMADFIKAVDRLIREYFGISIIHTDISMRVLKLHYAI